MRILVMFTLDRLPHAAGLGYGSGMKKSLMFMAILLGVLIVAGVVLSNYQKQLGISKPSNGAKAAVAAAISLQRVAASGQDDYRAYSEAVRVALVAHKRLSLRNPIDPQVRAELGRALTCYSAAREAWQAEVEGEWDDDVYGDRDYWRAIHPDVAESLAFPPGEEPLTLEDVKAACFAAADGYLERAVDLTTD